MTCPLCLSNTHVAGLEWSDGVVRETKGTPVNCAFKTDEFNSDNWSCGTMARLRELCTLKHRDDLSCGSIGVIPIPDHAENSQGYLVLTWYKGRGATGGARIVNDDEADQQLTLNQAIEILALLNPGER